MKKDSVASIKTQGLLGDQYVEISFGSAKGEAVHNGDMIAGEVPKDMSEQARAIEGEAQEGVAAFRDDMQALQQNFLLRGYFNKRGYSDTTELKQDAVARLPSGPRAKEFDYDATRVFDKPDSAKLKDKKLLDEAGHYLEDNEFTQAVVTSSEVKGDSDKDRVLTEARAKVVRDYLADNFKFDDKRLKTLGRGKVNDTGDQPELSIVIYGAKAAAKSASSKP